MGKIAVIDYGLGNLKSVSNALFWLGLPHIITREREALKNAGGIILPGVGAFAAARRNLGESGLMEELLIQAQRGKPLLGICLGMQLLFTESDEGGRTPGLNLIKGRVERIETPLKLPHIGWNGLSILNPSPLTKGLPENAHVYFVHSYRAIPEDERALCAAADYGAPVAAVVRSENVYGCQFHPEKSGPAGLSILKNFGGLTE